ncbi:hypothetical protein [Floridanema aerugineum]|uniref:HEPN AbiU2-like domain-containing protein n=1 Tax=Floridaenema aerugineum BLCC-F46 TaxID=3153654 RepID=A0ABV4X3X6_9CYAN
MQEIRNLFKNDLEESLLLAHSLSAMLSLGQVQIAEIISKNLDSGSKYIIPSCNQSDFYLAVLHQTSYGDILGTYCAHPGAVEEMIHARLIQRWYEFLSQVFEKILDDHFSGISNYNKRVSIEIDLKFLTDTKENLVTNLKERSVESFRFLKAKEQVKKIETLLDHKIPGELGQSINKHITVRNIFQHNKGVVRDDDLNFLGLQGNGITIFHSSTNPLLVKPGEKIILTFYELLKVGHDLCQAATFLIP